MHEHKFWLQCRTTRLGLCFLKFSTVGSIYISVFICQVRQSNRGPWWVCPKICSIRGDSSSMVQHTKLLCNIKQGCIKTHLTVMMTAKILSRVLTENSILMTYSQLGQFTNGLLKPYDLIVKHILWVLIIILCGPAIEQELPLHLKYIFLKTLFLLF